ncbi:MAG: GNAT family N-acetyltransferase [Culicoidibacterales bacterium]
MINELRFELMKQEDTEGIYKIWSDIRVTQYMNIEPMNKKETVRDMIKYFQIMSKRRQAERKTIFLGGEIIGSCGYNIIDEDTQKVEIGYEIAFDLWGAGLGEKIVEMLIENAKKRFNAVRIQAKVDPRNTRSLKLLEKCGFEIEGVLRKYEISGGVLVDMLILSKIEC